MLAGLDMEPGIKPLVSCAGLRAAGWAAENKTSTDQDGVMASDPISISAAAYLVVSDSLVSTSIVSTCHYMQLRLTVKELISYKYMHTLYMHPIIIPVPVCG